MPNVESFKVLTTLSAQRVVAMQSGTAHTVVYPEDKLRSFVGVTIDTVLDTTSSIPVQTDGKAWLYFNDTVTSGQLVSADTNGRGVPVTLANTTASMTLAVAYVGTLIGPKVDATGTIAEVLVNPGIARGV